MDMGIPPATTEISLGNGISDETKQEPISQSSRNGNDASVKSNESGAATATTPYTSSSVGSRLAGGEDNIIGTSRSATSNFTPSPIHTSSYPTPSFGVNQNLEAKSTLGFGNTVDKVPTKQKLQSLTLQDVQSVAAEKAEGFKSWSLRTYRCTKQLIAERMGHGTRTVDLELEARIEILRDTKIKYENVVALATAFSNHFCSMIQTQKVIGEAFGELSSKSQDLQEEFQYNAETQHILAKNGETLLAALKFFTTGVQTLCGKTMEDTIATIARYESARVEYDAYRTELDILKLAPRTEANIVKVANAEAAFQKQKSIYDTLRQDVGVKLQFLEENRMKVMQKQLLLFHNAITAYFAGNQQELQATIKQFSIKVENQSTGAPMSFLEGSTRP